MSGKTKGPTPALRGLIDHLQVCELLGVKPDTWRKRVASGSAPLPHARMGRRTYYRRADILAFYRTGQWPARVNFRRRGDSSASAG